MDWHNFSVKNSHKEQWAFEQMSYLLFCSEFNNNVGLFRYKNQSGIETEPLEKEGVWYGFSAKFYDVSIGERKKDVIDAITKAKNKNPNIEKIYFYINQELSESSRTNKKKPNYEIEIEEVCKDLGISLIWRVPSHFEVQLALPKNKYIYDLFFNLNPTLDQLQDNVKQHNLSILNAIRTSILVGDKKIELDRTEWITKLNEKIKQGKNIILSGEGGSGKTAIIKRFYETYSNNIPICIFKASELNINHLSDLFKFDYNFSLADFFDTYATEPVKIFIIDSAEKLSEISNQTVLTDLITKLSEYNWTVIFTTRLSYLDDLRFNLNESYDLKCDTLNLEQITDEELSEISSKFNIQLPKNANFKDRIRNLFYLNEYVRYISNETVDTFAGFTQLLWKKKIQNNSIHKNDIHIKRGHCFLEIAKERANTGKFYTDGNGLSQEALAGLKQDEILGYDEKYGGYFITHDIYEEWALHRIIEQAYDNYTLEDFFPNIGNSLPIRRAFRNWLSQQLLESNTKEIKKFIKDVFKNPSIEQFWKDELLVSVLLSDYSEEFFQFHENGLLADDSLVLKRILFLLQLACNDVGELYFNAKPKGKGWDATIKFIYQHQDSFFKNYYRLVLPILNNWSQVNHQGITTRITGLLALELLKRTETEEKLYLRDKNEELVYTIIFNACDEIKDELTEIFNMVIQNRWIKNNHPYNRFCCLILEKSYQASKLIQLLPKTIISLCKLFWLEKNYKKSPYGSDSFGTEGYYGLHNSYFNYSPASAHQTPVWWLLNSKEFFAAIEFIISFTNEAVTNYAHSNFDLDDVTEVTITINGNNFSQFHSSALWMMYRGTGSPVTPYLLQSMHMALEKFLLELATILDKKIVENLLLGILYKSKSSSLTSVVCSIVLAYPHKFENIALILFSSRDFFHADLSRWDSENQAKLLYSIGYGLNYIVTHLYNDERLKTCEDTHRKNHLENLCLAYQFQGVRDYSDEENTKFIQTIFEILDKHNTSFTDSEEDVSKSILFARMDRRKLIPEFIEDKNEIHFLTELTEEQKLLSESSQLINNNVYKYIGISLWSNLFRNDGYEGNKIYDENPLLALKEVKELIQDLQANNSYEFILFNKTIPYKVCAKLILEHSEKLSRDESNFCKNGIIESIQRLALDNYDYQISDGVEECTHALPKLIELFPEETDEFIELFVIVLFNQYPIGEYKRICDYAIESIHDYDLWQNNPYVANQILNAYIKYKPIFNQAIFELRNNPNYDASKDEKTSVRFEKFQDLLDKTSGHDESEIIFDISQLENFEINDLEIVLQILPNDTDDNVHLGILNKITPEIANILLKSKDREHFNSNHDLYSVRQRIFKKISNILLNRECEKQINELLQPFLIHLKSNEYTSDFIEEIILSEDKIQSKNNFWCIWKFLYRKIIEISSYNLNGRSEDSIIINYLLAWNWWGEKQTSWQSLNQENLWLYEDISNGLPNHPAVFYSITRVLYSVGSNFHEDGINWLSNIVSVNPKLELRNLESNTLFYLEMVLRQYIFINREKIKKDFKLKNKIIGILNFMVERASVRGYLLRENIF
ncbi:AVAST type 4 anti-phage nuclease Avs4 [Wielerella bovis]|uniref:AVAST type 4 anti-phage nuclease Avs4 n=1 Tax=Wielerella bovis TaxID=2917790 RepID=UPI0020195ADF|nr:AVAST type 4 anti-phage nuclease Avs4 [Wielerella bovis]ULJ60021.1 ATP-binding protein [Wielerella bovis]